VISFLRLLPDGTIIMSGSVPEAALEGQRKLYPDLVVVDSLTEWVVSGKKRKPKHQAEIGDRYNRATGKIEKRPKTQRKPKKG
jgi:hypothetical protein